MDYNTYVKNQLQEAADALHEFRNNPASIASVYNAATLISEAFENGNKVVSCGNGGSMSDAMHFAEELTARYQDDRKALPAIAISDPGHISCTANDYGYEHVFSRYIEAHGKTGDVLFAISTSGNSDNILKAADTAKKQGMKVIGLSGNDGGKLLPYCDVMVCAPASNHSDRIQEIHIKVIHIIISLIERKLNLNKD
ncbi:MAG: D-sedoheptulose 7-phosphate isomerase [Bacteroidota bacterium]|nr:D-sedoheptulose 7-phosphate isomerase [Bacteroidota bacterium]